MSNSELIYTNEGEVRFTRDMYILSETDSRGMIKYANENFLKISGYDISEVINQNQNMLRHKDMPKEIFKDLWYNISNKGYWKGFIKNKTKDGKYYWIKTSILKKQTLGEKFSYLATSIPASSDEIATVTKKYSKMK